MSKRINERGDEEREYILIREKDGQCVEERFWSILKFPSWPTSYCVRADDADNIEAHRACVRRQIGIGRARHSFQR